MNTQSLLSAQKQHLAGLLEAINERFARLQDTLGLAMWHSLVLSGEQAGSFIKILANALHALKPDLFQVAHRFVHYAEQELGIFPASADFASEFAVITAIDK